VQGVPFQLAQGAVFILAANLKLMCNRFELAAAS